MNCVILNNQRLQCLYGELEQISSFKDAEFRDIFIINGLYFVKHKQRSLSQVQISDNPVPRFVHGKWIRGNIAVDGFGAVPKQFGPVPKLISILDAVQKEKFKFVQQASLFMV